MSRPLMLRSVRSARVSRGHPRWNSSRRRAYTGTRSAGRGEAGAGDLRDPNLPTLLTASLNSTCVCSILIVESSHLTSNSRASLSSQPLHTRRYQLIEGAAKEVAAACRRSLGQFGGTSTASTSTTYVHTLCFFSLAAKLPPTALCSNEAHARP